MPASFPNQPTHLGLLSELGNHLLSAPALRAWPPTEAEARTILENEPYDVVERIGYGGMGAVFLVKNLEPGMHRLEALKIRRPETRDDEQFRERFLLEISTLAKLNHPGLTTVYRSGESDEGYLWFSMEYLEGKTLAELTEYGGVPLPSGRVLDITRQLCQTLQFIHESGYLHRDLKPANVMVCEDGSVRLLDFGIVSHNKQATIFALTRPGESPSTPGFAAPEQKSGSLVDQRTDLYGLGRIICEMIRPTIRSTGNEQLQYSSRLLDLVDELLAYDPNARPSSAANVMEKLGQIEPGSLGFWGRDRCPFRGLEAYHADHSEIFFGRDDTIKRGMEILQSRNSMPSCGFLLITGASGSGKSSLARAGLGPALMRGNTHIGTGRDTPKPVVFDLGTVQPENNCLILPLARAIASSASTLDPIVVAAALRDRNVDLTTVLVQPVQSQGILAFCLILDQFENFFRADLPRTARNRFIDAISRLAHMPGMVVLATLRGDYYQSCADHPVLMALKEGRHLDVCAPQSWELAMMLRLSARASNIQFESGPDGRCLDDLLLEHARSNPQALPLLSYVLEQLWLLRDVSTNTLRIADYQNLGGFAGAIAEKARIVFSQFLEDYPEDALPAIHDLFHMVVEIGDAGSGSTFVRRRASSHEVASASDAVKHLAERLVSARLIVRDSSGMALAHDALLTPAVVERWEILEKWLKDSEQNLRVRERVALRCRDWSRHGQSDELLLPSGTLLMDSLRLLDIRPVFFSDDEKDYLKASRAQEEKVTQAIQAANYRKNVLRRRIVVFLSLSTCAACAAAGLFWHQRAVAREQEEKAVSTRREADKILAYIVGPISRNLSDNINVQDLKSVQEKIYAYYDKIGVDEASAENVRMRALASTDFGDILLKAGVFPGAEKAYSSALAGLSKLIDKDPTNKQLKLEIGRLHGKLSAVFCALKRENEALAHREFQIEKVRALVSEAPANLEYRRELGRALFLQGENKQSLSDHKEALALRNALLQDAMGFQDYSAYMQEAGESWHAIASLQINKKQWLEALQSCREALKIRQELANRMPDDAEVLVDFAETLRVLSEVEAFHGNLSDSRKRLKMSAEILSKQLLLHPTQIKWAGQLGLISKKLAGEQFLAGEHDAAKASLLEAIRTLLPIAENAVPDEPLLCILCAIIIDYCDATNAPNEATMAIQFCSRTVAAILRHSDNDNPVLQKYRAKLVYKEQSLRQKAVLDAKARP